MVQAYPVRTLPSAGFVGAAGMARHGVGGSALVVGDPAADTLATRGAVALRGAAEEAAQVARLYARARLLVGAHADRRRVLALLPSSSIFHFAGHAVANSEQPELSYLALVAGGADDGLLRAREIGALRLSHLGMVVLSACNTLGARATHAGPIAGLAYSFLRAGVPAMLSSLWDVNDDATTPLLVAFHRRAAGGMGAAEALRAAQLEALESDRPETRAPRVWAAFVYSGP
ncbi:CHAT domain protein (plasmid) [Gemmatirosa kalamazoonensis]|uniref:CHAT domain protein n=1 Tax=Gemmatirosa kalamazoonensis TaxID=861299 RepID=W0RP69_9BACT|nr:CHAT domain protein [Gemmatirosa kalamazoonensis]